ncbi:MAG: DUF1289 domain-containing protein [Psychromonas sp.]
MSNLDSPCIRQCALNDDNICISCFRSLDEISQWSKASDMQKLDMLSNRYAREKKLNTKMQ